MAVIASSWKRSLAAVALAALIGPASDSGVAQEREKPAAPEKRDGQPNPAAERRWPSATRR